jgi:transposase
MVEETLVPGSSIAKTARNHGVNANQVHSWRRLYERGLLGDEAEQAALLPVRVVPESPSLSAVRLNNQAVLAARPPQVRRSRSFGVIQVEVERGRLRIEGAADPMSLRVVLESLLG